MIAQNQAEGGGMSLVVRRVGHVQDVFAGANFGVDAGWSPCVIRLRIGGILEVDAMHAVT
jgi:hypothetical protein